MNRLILGLAVFASVATALPAISNAQIVDQREADQHQRIAQGVHSGKLTAGETHNLARREAGLHHTERKERLHQNGHLTYRERVRLGHRENRISHAIYRDKHNARVD